MTVDTSLSRARLYLVSEARLRAGNLADMVPELSAAGVDVIQLREKELEAGRILELGAPIASACKQVGTPLIVNDRADIALALGAEGVHLGQDDLPVPIARRILGPCIVGGSTHSEQQFDEAVALGHVDYVAIGPVFPTPTKEGRPGIGVEVIRSVAERPVPMPWFAIGGIDADNIDEVMDAGARRVVVVRAIAHAEDPPAAAARLRAALDRTTL